MTPGSGGYPQTAGLRWRIQGRVVVNAQVGGQPINPGRSYRLAVNNFTAIGGDGYPKLNSHPGYVDFGFNDAEVLRAYIARHSPLKVGDYAPGDALLRQ